MPKSFVYYLLAILLISMSGFCQPVLEQSDFIIEFGKAPEDVTLFRKILFYSTGDQPVRIDSINTFCKCIIIPLENKIIQPGDSLTVEMSLQTMNYSGPKEWQPHIYTNGKPGVLRIRVKVSVVRNIGQMNFMRVTPHTVIASQFGDAVLKEFPFKLVNLSEGNIPLKLIHVDDEYFSVDFPAYIPPLDTAVGKIVLNLKGIDNEFEKTITFEYIDDKSERYLYSIPIRRKIYRAGQ